MFFNKYKKKNTQKSPPGKTLFSYSFQLKITTLLFLTTNYKVFSNAALIIETTKQKRKTIMTNIIAKSDDHVTI